MDDRMLVEMTELSQTASDMKTTIDTLTEIQKTIGELGKKSDVWRGAAADQFCENRKELEKQIEAFSAVLDGSRQTLLEAVATYERIEQISIQKVEALSTDDIF